MKVVPELVANVFRVRVSVEKAEQLLQTNLGLFQHGERKLIRSRGSYHLPSVIAHHVGFVGGLRQFPPKRKGPLKVAVPRPLVVTPDSIHRDYQTGNVVNNASSNSQSVAQVGYRWSAFSWL